MGTKLIISELSGEEDTKEKRSVIDVGNTEFLENISIKDIDDLQIIFKNKVVRIQIKIE